MANYLSASDVAHLNKHVSFVKNLPQDMKTFNNGLGLDNATQRRIHSAFEVDKLLSQASRDTSIWTKNLADAKKVHTEFNCFIDEFVRLAEQLRKQTGRPDPSWLIKYASAKIYKFLTGFNAQRHAMLQLTKGTYSVLPRLIDYMNQCTYQHAHQHNMISGVRAQAEFKFGSIVIVISQGSIEAQRRRKEALRHIENYRCEYALSYLGASNLVGHFTWLKELAEACLGHAILLNDIKTHRPRFNSKVAILRASLNEIQRISRAANLIFHGKKG